MTFEPSCEGKEEEFVTLRIGHSMIGSGCLKLTQFWDQKMGPLFECSWVEVTWGRVTGEGDQKDKLRLDLFCQEFVICSLGNRALRLFKQANDVIIRVFFLKEQYNCVFKKVAEWKKRNIRSSMAGTQNRSTEEEYSFILNRKNHEHIHFHSPSPSPIPPITSHQTKLTVSFHDHIIKQAVKEKMSARVDVESWYPRGNTWKTTFSLLMISIRGYKEKLRPSYGTLTTFGFRTEKHI